ncbi:hypothetical protein EDB92DRAFT_1862816 [Lactarius akahatsu]|uniref:Uncharacterized protein n=1 Tax=Lactarius akahatsu TaxID=416441 RepID=A0AAD4LF51_9AGAM|nr:hypothetical protein EDB92DRAFT_1862816 [Lactarius akahatsu]
MTTARRLRGISSVRFKAFTSIYIDIPILPQHGSSPPLVKCAVSLSFLSRNHPCFRSATSLATIRTRHLTSTTTLPPRPLLSPPRMITLLRPVPPVPMRLPCPHPLAPHIMSTKALQMCYHMTTKYMFRGRSSPLIVQLLKVSAFFPLPKTKSQFVGFKAALTPPRERCTSPLWNLRHPPLLLPQWPRPPHLVPLPFCTPPTTAHLRTIQFHRHLLPLRFSAICPLQNLICLR